MLKRVYVEITNVCNLSCGFCAGTKRAPAFMTAEQFSTIAAGLKGHTAYLYFHLMGEPLLHPQLAELLRIAGENGFRAVITTNGTLLPSAGEMLISAECLHRVNISLQAFEANKNVGSLDSYIGSCARFAAAAAKRGVICSLRLWNGGGADALNSEIESILETYFPPPWSKGSRNECLSPGIFLEKDTVFDWPDMSARELGSECFCHGLRDHIGVLCDGRVVPCCLDHDGDMVLGDLLSQTLDDILSGERARNIYNGFSGRKAREELCRRCGYARRFNKE